MLNTILDNYFQPIKQTDKTKTELYFVKLLVRASILMGSLSVAGIGGDVENTEPHHTILRPAPH